MVNILDVESFSKGMKIGLSYFDKKEDNGKMKLNIDVCKNCLQFLNYKDYEKSNYIDKQNIYQSFDLNDFFEHFKYIFRCLPLYDESNYSKDWARVSNEFREKSSWICSCCNVNLTNFKGFYMFIIKMELKEITSHQI